MKVLILNLILYTTDNNVIPKVNSIKDTMIYNMCLGFKQLGHNITLAASKEYEPIEKEQYDFNIFFFKSNYKKIFPPSVLPYSKRLRSFLKATKDQYDLIISSEVFSFPSMFAALICPQKTIIWQELTAHQNKMHKIPSKLWHNGVTKIMQKVNAVVPRSENAYKFIHKYMPMTVNTIVDHGININKFFFSTKKERQIISSSQLIYRKNVDGIIRIFKKLNELPSYSDIKLLIAGRGDEEKNLKILVKDLGLTEKVFFIGFLSQEKLNSYIRNSLCFLVNTRKDLNMVSIPESIVSGTPILTNTQPASAGYIKDNQLGIVKDNWSINELKEIIDNNSFYVSNCIKFRNILTNIHSAEILINIFLEKGNQKS